MWDLQLVDLILFLVKKCVTAEVYFAILEDLWGGLRNGKLKFCSVWSVPVVFCLVTGGNGNAAVIFSSSFCHASPFHICAHTATHQNHEPYHHSFCIPFQPFPCFLVPSFLGEKVWEHYKLFTNRMTRILLLFSHPFWESQPCKKWIFLAVLFPSFFFLQVTNLLYASSLSSGQISGFWGLILPCYCEFI